jgi:hypothetical protein
MKNTDINVGLAIEDITPPIGTELGGFGFRSKPAAAIHTNLYAKTLCIQKENQLIAITVCDLLLLTGKHKAKVRHGCWRVRILTMAQKPGHTFRPSELINHILIVY